METTALLIRFEVLGIIDASIFPVGRPILVRSAPGVQLTVPKPRSSAPAGRIDRVPRPLQNALQDRPFIPVACCPMTNYFS